VTRRRLVHVLGLTEEHDGPGRHRHDEGRVEERAVVRAEDRGAFGGDVPDALDPGPVDGPEERPCDYSGGSGQGADPRRTVGSPSVP